MVVGPTPSSATARLRTASLRECIAETADGERSPTVSFLDMICLVSPSKAAPILFSDIATSQMYLFCLIGLLVDLTDFAGWLVIKKKSFTLRNCELCISKNADIILPNLCCFVLFRSFV